MNFKKEPTRIVTTFFTCAHGRIIVFCHKRKMPCPYFGSIQCDDHECGEPKKVHEEMVIMGPIEKFDSNENKSK